MRQDSRYNAVKGNHVGTKGSLVPALDHDSIVRPDIDSNGADFSKTGRISYKRPIATPTMPELTFVMPSDESTLVNKPESRSFIATALAWQGSVTPRVLPRVAVSAIYAAIVYFASTFVPTFAMPITPFEYSGAVLALILVLRVNAGHDRWWEARRCRSR